MSRRVPLKRRIEQDENFILKIGGELGDLCKILRNQQAQIKHLHRRVERLEKQK
jgi:hypothetical protein